MFVFKTCYLLAGFHCYPCPAAHTPRIETHLGADVSKFADTDFISGWVVDAISWANAEGLIQGDGAKLMPIGNAERCQVAGDYIIC